MHTVLVVDDTPSQLELVSHYLLQQGYQVIRAGDAQEAIAKASAQKPDVIITDVMMPGMSGFELCRSLKKNPATEQVRIIICSSKNQRLDQIWGMRQGADAYVTKPFTAEELLSVVASVVA